VNDKNVLFFGQLFKRQEALANKQVLQNIL